MKEDEEKNDYFSNETTLLQIKFVPQPNVSLPEAAQAISQFSQSFPFAAVLPVQPLQYLPTADGGVEIKFLRKKTDLKSGMDGGIRFFLHLPHLHNDNNNNNTNNDTMQQQSALANPILHGQDDEEVEQKKDKKIPPPIIELTAKRNSRGQTFPKIVSEKLLVTAYVAALTKLENNHCQNAVSATYSSTSTPVGNLVLPTSIFHKWM